MAGLCEGGNEPPGSLKARNRPGWRSWYSAGLLCPEVAAVMDVIKMQPQVDPLSTSRNDCTNKKKRLSMDIDLNVESKDPKFDSVKVEKCEEIAVAFPLPAIKCEAEEQTWYASAVKEEPVSEEASDCPKCRQLIHLEATGVAQLVKALACRSEVALGHGFIQPHCDEEVKIEEHDAWEHTSNVEPTQSLEDQKQQDCAPRDDPADLKWCLKNTGHNSRSLPSKETLRGHSDSSFRGEGYIQCCVGVRLCDMYSNQELAEIHFMYGKADGNAVLARRLYQERYPQRQCPDRKTFVRLHYRLCEYGKFNSPGLGRGRPRSTTPEVQEEILEAVNMTPSISTRRVVLQVNVPHTTAWRLLKEYQLYLYHLQRVQALSPADYPARVRFYEAQFTRDGITNFHNQHVWAYENPRATVPFHHQVRFSLNMWAGIIGDRLVGPHVLVNRLTGQAYTNFVENTIPHVLEDTPLINRQHIHFFHDGAPAHFSRTARRYLDRRFPDRWIGRGGPIAWPPRSPDLNPLDFYLWGHLKSLVYSSSVPDLESLRDRIVACSEDIYNTPGVWDRVCRSMRHRCEVCIQAGGGHFEHLL
ncbi:hypothetical protein ANN_27520 [Periplaneta americana]|uniref:DUF4817 domain-containing protein n=1 Tax=Periplaneta americana TaxID=6978 RepID=A0ABQ8RW05_PERAM|nr:hypothetical protein ANN_27520 [Periplaneta americana]